MMLAVGIVLIALDVLAISLLYDLRAELRGKAAGMAQQAERIGAAARDSAESLQNAVDQNRPPT